MKHKIIIYFITILFLHSCTGVQDALEGKKRSDNPDEFLVEKKNPLTVPPDMNKLPIPLDEEENKSKINDQETLDIEKVFNSEESKNSNNKSSGENSLEKTILEKINN